MSKHKESEGHTALLIAASVAIVAVIGLILVQPSMSGKAVVKGGIAPPEYTNSGVRTDAEYQGWQMGRELGKMDYTSGTFGGKQGNRQCITECGNRCASKYSGSDVPDCFKFCKTSCEMTTRNEGTTGGYEDYR